MANILSKTGIVSLATIRPWHVSQSVDAFAGLNDYDITISGSLTITGSVYINSLITASNVDVVTIDPLTGQLFSTASNSFNSITNITNSITNNVTNSISNYYTSSISNSYSSSTIINNYTSSTTTNNLYTSSITNNFYTSSVNNSYTSSVVNNNINQPAPSDQYIQYNSGSTFGADTSFQFIYPSRSLQQGDVNTASGVYSHAGGKNTTSNGIYSHTEGRGTSTIGNGSHAEGDGAVAQGNFSHAEGYLTISSGEYSHTEGSGSVAIGIHSHAEGATTVARGDYSHAEGKQTTAFGNTSHAEGYNTIASSEFSHAEGYFTVAQGVGAHSEGYFTTASGDYQHVSGQYNLSSTAQSAFIVGNGIPSRRSNILFASGSSFQVSSSLNLSGSFSPQYRYIGSVQVPGASPGILLSPSDYNVTFQATTLGVGNKNEILLPINTPTGSVLYLQRISGTSACRISGSGTHTINGAAGYTFPTGSFARRMFVFHGSGWYTEPNPLV